MTAQAIFERKTDD